MWGAWGGQWGAKPALSYPDLLALSIKKNTVLVGGWTETACYSSILASLSGTSIHGRESLAPADLLCSHLAQHPTGSSLLPSNPAFSLQELLNWILSEPFLNLVHFGLNNIPNILLVPFQSITEPVLSQSRTELGLAVPYFIHKHVRNVPFGWFSACPSLYRRCFITSVSPWRMTRAANQDLILWSCKFLSIKELVLYAKNQASSSWGKASAKLLQSINEQWFKHI